MKKTGLISFVVLVTMAGQAIGDVEIFPEHPTSCDVVVITLSGLWGNSCVPNYSAISMVGNDIYFDVIWNYPPDIVCAHVITPWERTRSAGPLAPGTYSLYARLVGYPYIPETYTLMAEFTVTAESCIPTVYYVDAVDGNDLNDGLTPETAFATIQKGVDKAKSGDTVIVAPGVYIDEGNRDIDFYCKAITVRSINPTDPEIVDFTIVDCNGIGCGFNFHSNEGPNSVLAGLTITNGYAGIRCRDYSGPTISHCIITENCAGYYATGIWCDNSSPTITNCTISENSVPYGRGIYACNHSKMTIIDCIIADNVGADHGGGIYCRGGGSLTITGSAIRGNSATFRGGGIHVGSLGVVTITNCIISDNTANSYCGGGFFSYGSSIVVANCTFSNNSAPNGNALAFDSWSLHPSDVQLKNCILWDGGNEIWNDDGSTIRITYSDIWSGWAGEGNIDTDPCFADPCSGDYHLKSQAGRWDTNTQSWFQDDVTSPCIDRGDPSSSIGWEPYPNGGRINMGAYGGTEEASKSYFGTSVCQKPIAGDINGDCKVDFIDFVIMTYHWLEDNSE